MSTNITASAWRLDLGNSDPKFIYRIQLEGVNLKNQNKIVSSVMNGWNQSGSIFSSKDVNYYALLFTKEFNSVADWNKWAKSFPYSLTELGMRKNSTKVFVKEEKISETKEKKNKKHKTTNRKLTICSKCNHPGHNARTCSKHSSSLLNKSSVRQQKNNHKQCSWCCEYGHNKRTCPELKKKKKSK